jgi:hypothetical protein
MALDPMCGVGTGYSVRCGILASATVASMASGAPEAALRSHYAARLLHTFRAHLEARRVLYASTRLGEDWRGAAERGLSTLPPSGLAPARYRLSEFDLIAC